MFRSLFQRQTTATVAKVPSSRIPWKSTEPAGDRFRGEIATHYLADRVGKEIWDIENHAVTHLMQRVPDGSSVLDVPFGTGRFVDLYRQKKMSISGLDSSPDMIAQAQKMFGKRFMSKCDVRVGDAMQLPWPDQSFDVAVCVRFCGSIIAAKNVPAFLTELRRVTRSHMIINLNCRSANNPPQPVDPDGRMGSRMRFDQVEALLKSTGWQVEETILTKTEAKGDGEKRMWLLS